MKDINCMLHHNALVNISPFIPHAYESLDKIYRSYITEEMYASYIAWYTRVDDVKFFTAIYESDGFRVKGIVAQPAVITNNHPVIIYNRGGSNIPNTVKTLKDNLYFWAQHGFIVFAPQYRGTDGSDGIDECGGSDVHDVTALIKIAYDQPYIDKNKIFIIGPSRGAVMSLLALKSTNIPIKALTLIGGLTDLFALEKSRPELLKPLFDVLGQITAEEKEEAFRHRSAIRWANEIKVPILLLHGGADTVVDKQQSINLAEELEKNRQIYKLIIYGNGDHSLNSCREEMHQDILRWFNQFE
jgi:dipeptidyl aminopeptidase/acylaminoacyl peptidase